jgi:hypothetical protein
VERTLSKPHPVNAGFSIQLAAGQGFTTLLKIDGDLLSPVTLTAQILVAEIATAVPGLGADPSLRARLDWGVGGAACSVDFDPMHGQSITVSATFFHLMVSYPGVVGVAHPMMQATGILCYGTRGSVNELTFTSRLGLVAGGGGLSPIVIVPAWAVDVRLLTDVPAQYGSFRIGQAQDPAIERTSNFPSDASTATPLSGRTRSVQVTNTGVLAANVELLFGLSFG